MKKRFTSSIFAMFLVSFATHVVMPKSAGAVISVSPRNPWNWLSYNGDTNAEVVLCAILLPICLLDEQTDGVHGASRTDLAANGYSPEEIDQIMKDQNTLAARLKAKGLSMKISNQDTKASIESQVRSVDPAVSQTYLDFVTGAAGQAR